MSTPFNLQPRFDEVADCTKAAELASQLSELNRLPPNKQWNRQRDLRRSLWQQLHEVAVSRHAALATLTATPRRPRTPRVVTKEPGAPTPEQAAAPAEYRADAVNNR